MFKKLGPGILLAGAAIGGSHLVASMFAANVPAAFRPSKSMQWLSISGIIFLSGFGTVFLYWYIMV
jgi:hypothetical protein